MLYPIGRPKTLGSAAGTGASTATTRSLSEPKQPSYHHHDGGCLEESDGATTACSSWIGDASSQLTPSGLTFRSGHSGGDVLNGTNHDVCDCGNDDHASPSSYPRTISPASRLSSSLEGFDHAFGGEGANDGAFTAIGNDDDVDAWDEFYFETHPFVREDHRSCDDRERAAPLAATIGGGRRNEPFRFELHPMVVVVSWSAAGPLPRPPPSTAASLVEDDSFAELRERARRMIRRESDREIDDYFHRGDPYSPTGDDGDGRHAPYSPIDAGCRPKMMEWSLRVAEYSFPRRPPPPETYLCPFSPAREYSTEAVQIVSQAFDLVDRLCTLRFRRSGGRAMDRREYKLICMACIHLASKTCGLFSLYENREEEEEEEDDSLHCYDVRGPASRSATLSTPGSASSSRCEGEGQTIVSTPSLSHGSDSLVRGMRPSNEPPKNISVDKCSSDRSRARWARRIEPTIVATRPPLDLLSLSGLSALCQGEYSLEQLIRAEWTVLNGLDWKLTSITGIDWHHMLMDALRLVLNFESETRGGGERRRNEGERLVAEIRERSLACLELLMRRNDPIPCPPSMAAWSGVAHALDDCDARPGCEEMKRAVSSYWHAIQTLVLPSYGEEEVNAVRMCF